MEGIQEQICAGCEFYEENYKKALDRFLLYKEKIMCTQTLIQKYERRKQHNQQLMRKLLKSRQNVAAVRERFMHYMERYMPLEKSYNDLRAAHNDLEDKMHTQGTTLVALQQHNKQLSALVDVQEKELNEYKEKHGKLEDEFKRKVRMNQLAKAKANEKHRCMVKAAVELAVILKDKGILPDSYKLCLRSWKKQLIQDMKRENLCDNGGLSPDKASSISSQDTGFDSSKSMSDDENPFDENVMRRKGAAGDNGCSDTSKSVAAQEKSFCDKSVNTIDIVRSFSSSCVTDNFHNLRDIGVNTSLSMLTSDMFFNEVTKSDFKNSGQSPPDQGMENHDLEPLPFDIDSQIANPHWSHQTSLFSPVKGAVRSATAEKLRSSGEKPPTSVEMPPSNACVDEYQSSDEIPATNTAVSASPQMCSKDLGASALSFVKCDSFQTDFEVSQTCSNNDSVFQQQPAQLGNMKKQNLMVVGKRNGIKKKKMSKKSNDQDTVGTNRNSKVEIEPLKRVCDKECPSKYSSVLAKFSIGKDVSPMHHSSIKEEFTIGKDVSPTLHSPVKGFTIGKDVSPMHHSSIKEKINSNNILSDPKYTNIFTHDFVKSLNHLTSLIVGKKLLKFTKKNGCQRSRKLRKKKLKAIHSPNKPKKHSAISKPPSSYSNIVETASGCFVETVNDSPISVHSVESTPEIGKFEERLTVTETVNCYRDKPNAVIKVSGRKSEISQLQCNTNSLAGKKQSKKDRSRLRLMVSQEVEKSQAHTEMNILHCERLPLTLVKQKGVQHKESVKSNVLARNFQPEMDNQTRKSLEKLEKDTKSVVKKLDSTDNCEGTVSNSVCSSTIPNTLLLSTNDTSAELKRKDTDTESRLGYTELLGDLSVSDDDSSPESTNGNSELSQCVEAEGSNESSNESDVASHNFPKTDVPQKSINKICNKQYNSERNEEMFEHNNVSYSIPQKVKDNNSVVKCGETETNIPVECRQEICVRGQSVDLLGQKYDSDYEVKKINLICEAGEPISEISASLPASCNTGAKTKDAEVSFSKLNSGVFGSTSEFVTVNEAGLEMNSVSSSINSTGSLAQAEITTDCPTQVSVPASKGDGTVDCTDELHDNNTEIFIQGSDVNTDKDMGVQGSLASNEIVDKRTDSTDTHDTPYIDSKLSKDLTGTDSCIKKLINHSETHPAIMKGHKYIKEKHCSNNKSSDICKAVKNTEVLTMKSCLQKGAVEDQIGNHNKNCDVSVNGKFENELEEEITHPNNLLNEDLIAQKCEMNLMSSNCNVKKSVINCSESEQQIVKEQQESNKDDIPVEKIPQPELDVSKQEVGEVTDTAETYCEEYYTPQRTKKRIAHKPKPQASGSNISSEDKNFKSPTKGTKKRTPKKTKPITEDEQRHTETVNTRTHNLSSKHLGSSVHDTGRDLASLLLNVGTDSTEEKRTLETECFSTKVTENVNYVSEARKELKNEVESGTDAVMNTTRKKQLKMSSLDTQLEPSSAHLQTTRRSSRLKKSVTLKLLENGFDVQVTKRRKKLNDEKYSTPDSSQDLFNIDSVKTEKCDDGGSSAEMNHVEEDKCDVNKALLAGEPVATVQNSEVEKLHKSECDTDDGAADPSIGGNKRKIKNETGDESSRKKLAPCLFEKQSCYQTEFENEAKFPVESFNLENASDVSCKSESQTPCLVPLLSENKCKEECAGGNISTSTCQQPDEGGSVTSSKSKTSLEETISNTDTGHSNGECIYVHNNSESDFKSECIRVSYAKGEILRKCLAIQQRNKFTARRPTRKILNQQEVFVSHQLSQLLKEDFTNEVLNTAVQMCGKDDIPVDAMAVVRCVLKVLLQEDCNEIDRNIDVRAPPLSVVEEKLLTFLITLRNSCSRFSTLINDFLSAVEYYVLNLRTSPEIDLLHILTRFHASLCRAEGLRERAQALCYDTLYCLKRKCFPVVYTILTYYAEVLPKAPLGMSSPICVSIVYSIFTSMNQAIDTNLRIKPLITLLCRIYGYKLAEVLSFDLVQCFLHHLKCQNSKAREVCAAITLLAKRNDKTWTLTQLIPKYLAPLIHEWRLGKINDTVVSDVIDIIGCVVKPFCEQHDVGPIIKIFKGILHADQVTHALKMKAALSLARQAAHHFSEVAPALFEWTPEAQLPDEFWEQMSNILSVKPRNHWITFLSTWEENTEEKRVGAVNN